MSSRIPATSSRKTASLFKGDPKHLLIDEDVTVSTPAPRMGGLTPEVSHQQSNPWSSRGERLQLTPRQPVNLATEPSSRRPAPSPEPAAPARLPVTESRLRDSFRRTEVPDLTSPVFDKGYARTEVPAPEAPPLRIFVGAKDNQRVRMPIVNQIWPASTVVDNEDEEESSGPTQRVSTLEESEGPSLISPRRVTDLGALRSNGFQSGPWKPQGRSELTMAENVEATSGPISAAEEPSEEISSKVPPAFALPRSSFGSSSSDQNLFGGPTKRPTESAAPAPFAFEAPPEEQTSKLPMPTGFQPVEKTAAKVGEVKPEVKPAALPAPGSGRFVPVAIVAVFVVLGIVAYTKVQDGSLGALMARASAPAAAPTPTPLPAPAAPEGMTPPAPPVEAVAVAPTPTPAPEAPPAPAPAPTVTPVAVAPVEAPPVAPVAPVEEPPPPAPTPTVAAAAANPDDGILTITADVPARVWINGVDHGLAPVQGLALAPGSYRVEVKPTAGKGRAKTALVRVDPGRPKTVTFGLMKLK